MAGFTIIARDVSGDPLSDGGTIQIVRGSATRLTFTEDAGSMSRVQAGDAFGPDAGPAHIYQVLGTGNVRGDPLQKALFLRLEGGATLALDLHADTEQAAGLQSGDTALTVEDLDLKEDIALPFGTEPVCFAPGTLIATPDGVQPIETLGVGDAVWTKDNGPCRVRWIGHSAFHMLTPQHRHLPVRIGASSLGPNVPARDLMVSPQHCIVLNSIAVMRLTGEEVLVPARGLVGLPGVDVADGVGSTDYISLLLDRHEVLCANGALSESFYPGPGALHQIGTRLADEIEAAIPGLAADPVSGYGPMARTVLTRSATARIARICRENGDALSGRPAFDWPADIRGSRMSPAA